MLKIFSKIFGTQNDKEVKKYRKKIQNINNLESKYKELNDDELKEAFEKIKQSVRDGKKIT